MVLCSAQWMAERLLLLLFKRHSSANYCAYDSTTIQYIAQYSTIYIYVVCNPGNGLQSQLFENYFLKAKLCCVRMYRIIFHGPKSVHENRGTHLMLLHMFPLGILL